MAQRRNLQKNDMRAGTEEKAARASKGRAKTKRLTAEDAESEESADVEARGGSNADLAQVLDAFFQHTAVRRLVL